MKRACIALASLSFAAFVVSGCSTTPLSYIEGGLRTGVGHNLYPLRVVSVDGCIQFHPPIRVTPGPHWLTLEAAPSRGAGSSGVQKSFVLKIEPCTTYFLAAQRDSPLSADWALVVQETEPVGGCDPAEEWKKAGSVAGAPAASAPAAPAPAPAK